MDIGKTKLQSMQVYAGEVEPTVQGVIRDLNILREELAVTSGRAKLIASATITAGMAVNVNGGLLRPADASLSRPAIGIAITGASVGQPCRFMVGMGFIQGLTGLTADSPVYLGTAGALVYSLPTSGFIQGLGHTLSTTELFVIISESGGNAVPSGVTFVRKTANATLVAAEGDGNTWIEMNVAIANTLTFPPNSSVAIPISRKVLWSQYGAGKITFTAGAGVTLRCATALTSRAQYSSGGATKVGTDEWYIYGDTA